MDGASVYEVAVCPVCKETRERHDAEKRKARREKSLLRRVK